MNKQLVLRTCIASHCILSKVNLLRIVVNKNKNIFIDVEHIIPGRGAYLILNDKNIKLIQKKKILDKKLKIHIPNNIYQKLFLMSYQQKHKIINDTKL